MMKKRSNTKFVSDVDLTSALLTAKKPFKISKDDQRRFVRIEISTPMSMRKIKDVFGQFRPQQTDYTIEGSILNVSAGGVLFELEHPLNEGDIVSMRFRLQDVEDLQNVLGLDKRSDHDDGMYLCGIEFTSLEKLRDMLSSGEIDLIGDTVTDFNGSVQNALDKYIEFEQDDKRA